MIVDGFFKVSKSIPKEVCGFDIPSGTLLACTDRDDHTCKFELINHATVIQKEVTITVEQCDEHVTQVV